MVTKKNYILPGSVIAALIFIEANCTKFPLDCANTKYSFELPVKAFPNKDTIHVGDTIWLEINESTLIRDGRTGDIIDYSGTSNLGTALSFSFRDTAINLWADAANNFNFQIIHGLELRRTKLVTEYRFVENNGRYLFKLGVIPKVKGLYSLLFSNSDNTYRNSDKCTKASFSIIFKNTDQHYYLHPLYTGQTGLVGGDYYFFVQ